MVRSTPSAETEVGEPFEQHLQGDPTLRAGQRGTDAEVLAVTEGEVAHAAGPDGLDGVRPFEPVVVAVAGRVHQQQVVTGADRHPADLGVGAAVR